jgi:Zn-finger nucleic acid-binding protein
MECPKCKANMKERTLRSLRGEIVIDQCEGCRGLWFDHGEAELAKDQWRSEYVDSGETEVGSKFNKVRDINCPHCGKLMEKLTDPKQSHLEFEACAEHGIFMDAGEFTDFKYETVLDKFRALAAAIKRR